MTRIRWYGPIFKTLVKIIFSRKCYNDKLALILARIVWFGLGANMTTHFDCHVYGNMNSLKPYDSDLNVLGQVHYLIHHASFVSIYFCNYQGFSMAMNTSLHFQYFCWLILYLIIPSTNRFTVIELWWLLRSYLFEFCSRRPQGCSSNRWTSAN